MFAATALSATPAATTGWPGRWTTAGAATAATETTTTDTTDTAAGTPRTGGHSLFSEQRFAILKQY